MSDDPRNKVFAVPPLARHADLTPNRAANAALIRHIEAGGIRALMYGGNANFVGWELIGYPGIRMAVSEDEERMKVKPTAIRKSAYDDEMFTMKGGSRGH